MKVVIPVAGAGVNLRPLTYTQPKPLIPVAGKPIISFIVEEMIELGVDQFIFIIGYLGEKIKNFLEETYPQLDMKFVHQEERMGSGHAIWMAREYLQEAEELIIFFGDIIIDINYRVFCETEGSVLAIKKVPNPWEFGVVEFNEEGDVVKLVEKPRIPRSDMAMVGLYKIKEVAQLIDSMNFIIENKMANSKGEYTLTDILMRMVEKGTTFTTMRVDNWFDCSKKEVLLQTNAILLDRAGYASLDIPVFDNTIIIHPVSIGKNCKISDSIIGPHVTIGMDTVIKNAIVRASIIGNFAHIQEINLQQSVVGNDTSITGLRQSLNIGDNTEIDFSLPA